MKTKLLDANTSSAHANTSSVHERGSQPLARQGSVENTDDNSPSDKDDANDNDVPSDKDNSAPEDAVLSDPGTDKESQEGNSSQSSRKLLAFPFNFCLTALSVASPNPAASHDNETEDEGGESERLVQRESCRTSMPW